MPKATQPTFGAVIRERRRRLDLTQEEVARRIKTSTPYIGHLESGKRHPSEKVIARLSEVLGLQSRELFFLANPHARDLLSAANSGGGRRSGAHTISAPRRWTCWRGWRRWARRARRATLSISSMLSALR